jgi:hypothetical protein
MIGIGNLPSHYRQRSSELSNLEVAARMSRQVAERRLTANVGSRFALLSAATAALHLAAVRVEAASNASGRASGRPRGHDPPTPMRHLPI